MSRVSVSKLWLSSARLNILLSISDLWPAAQTVIIYSEFGAFSENWSPSWQHSPDTLGVYDLYRSIDLSADLLRFISPSTYRISIYQPFCISTWYIVFSIHRPALLAATHKLYPNKNFFISLLITGQWKCPQFLVGLLYSFSGAGSGQAATRCPALLHLQTGL